MIFGNNLHIYTIMITTPHTNTQVRRPSSRPHRARSSHNITLPCASPTMTLHHHTETPQQCHPATTLPHHCELPRHGANLPHASRTATPPSQHGNPAMTPTCRMPAQALGVAFRQCSTRPTRALTRNLKLLKHACKYTYRLRPSAAVHKTSAESPFHSYQSYILIYFISSPLWYIITSSTDKSRSFVHKGSRATSNPSSQHRIFPYDISIAPDHFPMCPKTFQRLFTILFPTLPL
jgi:hypothetical protein